MKGFAFNRSNASRIGSFFAGIVEVIIQPAQDLGGIVDEVDIRLGIEVAEHLVGVLEHVKMLDLRRETARQDRLLNGLGRPKMTCAALAERTSTRPSIMSPELRRGIEPSPCSVWTKLLTV